MGSAEGPAEGSEAVVDMDDDDEDEALEEEDEPFRAHRGSPRIQSQRDCVKPSL